MMTEATMISTPTAETSTDPLVIADQTFTTRLIVGTGKYETFEQMQEAHKESGADIVTVAIRRVNLDDRSGKSLMD